MILQSSFQSRPSISQQSVAVKQMMDKIKTPILRQIQKTKTEFHGKVIQAKFQSQAGTPFDRSYKSIQPSQQSSSSKCPTQIGFQQQPRILTESSCQDFVEKKKGINLGEWTLSQNKALFEKTEDMIAHYKKMFNQRVKFSSGKRNVESFKVQEKEIFAEIFTQIGDLSEKTIDFKSIERFFQLHPLFYRIYNIHPNSLKDVLSDSAHRYESKLTQEEFMNLFLLNNRTNLEYQTFDVQKTIQKCVLDDESWKDLKNIFDLFDTFGNETIQLKPFFHKLKNSISYKNLLKQNVVEFPAIQRSYSLKKILFELENKLNISDQYFKWKEIKEILENFTHIKSPTLDVIQKQYISLGKITASSNSFMINNQILAHLKDIFEHCPKFCTNFVKISHYCMEFLESEKSKIYLKEVVRNVPEMITVKEVLNNLTSQPLEYLDLDQIIQFFSIRGFDSEKKDEDIKDDESNSEQENIYKKIEKTQRARKNIENLPKKHNRMQSRDITKIQEFSLSKKTKESIRDKKVKQMIEESKQKDSAELTKKFKANPIPASINNEKYEEYRNKMNSHKSAIFLKLNQIKEKDIMALQYLQSNTKLFEKPKTYQPKEIKIQNFKAEPVPWFVHTNLLEQFDAEKEENRKKLRVQNKMKYIKEWKNLPDFIIRDNFTQSPAMTRNQSEKTIFHQLQINEVGLHETQNSTLTKKSKVKDVPNFKLLQQQFIEELQAKKKHYKPTIIEEFNLSSPRMKETLLSQSIAPKSTFKENVPLVEAGTNFIGSTLKYESMIKANFEKRMLEELVKKENLIKEKEREKHRKIFAQLVRKQMKKEIKSIKRNKKQYKSRANSMETNSSRKQMADMYARVFSRPFLFQGGQSTRKNKENVEKRAKPISMENINIKKRCIQYLHPQDLEKDEEHQEIILERSTQSRNSF